MSKYAIITDSASDLCKEYREANKIDYARTMMSWKKEDGQEDRTEEGDGTQQGGDPRRWCQGHARRSA